MFKIFANIYTKELEHHHRFLISLIVAELIFIAFIHFYPKTGFDAHEDFSFDRSSDVFIETMIATKQESAPASPPKPILPVPVPNDEIIEEEIEFPEFDDILFETFLEPGDGAGATEGEARIVGSPERPPSIVKIVEPTISDQAKSSGIKARILVTFLVDEKGGVEDLYISEIRLYNGNDYKIVQDVGYGILSATLEAASKWRFNPATDQGIKVKTYVENSFNIGF